VIEITGTSGKVREIGMRATTVATFDGADVFVPNATLISEKLVNWTLMNLDRRIEVSASVAYGSDPKRVLDLLLDLARSTPGVAAEPAPAVIFSALGSNGLEFTVRAWTNDFSTWVRTRSELTLRIHDGLIAAGLEIPFPQRDLHLRSVSAEAGLALTRQSVGGQEDPARTNDR
jgi:small-conductance mechanosensitive channel